MIIIKKGNYQPNQRKNQCLKGYIIVMGIWMIKFKIKDNYIEEDQQIEEDNVIELMTLQEYKDKDNDKDNNNDNNNDIDNDNDNDNDNDKDNDKNNVKVHKENYVRYKQVVKCFKDKEDNSNK